MHVLAVGVISEETVLLEAQPDIQLTLIMMPDIC